ncbi:H15 domain-containing protein [Forsythia ovata]|uniref:H15 domain-containing protein n=1 Tax=Forsythia ovata TaxID=205694 RepID=A0ABD1W966_9LAMI
MDSPKQSAEPISAHNHRDSAGGSGSSSHDQRHQHAMENFKELLMECITTSTPNKSLTPPQKSLVNQRLQEIFPRFHTPDHPPYAWMIQSAIKQLNEEGGSNEEAISQFISEEEATRHEAKVGTREEKG